MKIIIGSDHNGYKLKSEIIEKLTNLDYEVIDKGTDSLDSVDYPLYAKKVCEEVLKTDSLGILICGSGIGMSIAANKIKGIRCAKVDNEQEASLSKMHNNANVIAISSKKDIEEVSKIVLSFITNDFSNEERHIRRINEIE